MSLGFAAIAGGFALSFLGFGLLWAGTPWAYQLLMFFPFLALAFAVTRVGRFGSQAYAMEELVAELGAAFLCAELGITVEPRADHAQYLAHWLNVLKADKRAIFTAASASARSSRGGTT